MRKKVLAAVLAAVLLFGPGIPGASGAIIPDPFELILLARIQAALVQAYQFLRDINATVQEFRDLMAQMYPQEALDQLRMLFRNVNSIQEEIEKLSCDWRFTPRVEALRLGLLRKGPLCRSEYQRFAGAPVPGLDADLAELRQWNAVRRLNTVASTIEASKNWAAAANRYGSLTRTGGTSPGRALRYLGALEALNLMQEVRANTHEAELLSAAQEELDAQMREDWRRQNYAHQLTRFAIGSAAAAGRSLAQDLSEVRR